MQDFHLTLNQPQAMNLRLALLRSLYSVERIIKQYQELDAELYGPTVQKYETEAESIREVLRLVVDAWEDMTARTASQD